MLLGPGIITARGCANYSKVKLLHLTSLDRIGYALRVKSMDQVFVVKMWIINMITLRFHMKLSIC